MVASSTQADPPRTLAAMHLPRRVRRALENQLQTAISDLSRQLQVVLHETMVELGRQAERAQDHNVRSVLHASIRKMQGLESEVASGFAREIEIGLASIRMAHTTPSPETPKTKANELTLVEELDVDEPAILSGIAARSASRNSLALQLMGYRYGVLAASPAFDAERLPLGPHALCQALRATCERLDVATEARSVMYGQFDKIALAHYPALLETLNTRLADDGILPHLSFIPVRLRPATGPAMPPPSPEGDASKVPVGGRPDEVVGGTQRMPRPAESEPFSRLQALLAQRRVLLAKLRKPVGGARPLEALTRDEVLGALRRLRATGGKGRSIPELRQTLFAQARQAHGHGVTFAEEENDGAELLALFLTQLQRELRPDSPGEILVGRLRLPLLQLALRDHRFFTDARHPARMLLDAVSLAGARWLAEEDLDSQWMGLLQRAVAAIEEDPDATYETFVAANHALQGGLQAINRRNEMAERRQVEAARGRERLGLARRVAGDTVARLVEGKTLPKFHGILLEQAWVDVLSLTLLRSGQDSREWAELEAATVRIIDVGTSPGQTPEPSFLKGLQDALAQVGYHADDAAGIARQLAHGRVDEDLASRTELIVQLRSRGRLGEESAPAVSHESLPLTPDELAIRDALAARTEGTWIDLSDPAEGATVRRRLAWASARSGQALLLDRRGMLVADVGLDALTRELATGQARLVDTDIHPAEAAWLTTRLNLERIAGGLEPGASADV